ncbi:Mus7/MMS22 family-domain-containing protein [Russula compacta]|nr:Mus7/MMS22 family-domain-containing protein [Russula compacta]
MDVPLDAASTSDVDEREFLEAANSDLYWDRVVARGHLDSHPPNALSDQGDDMQLCTSQVYRRFAHIGDTHSSLSRPGLHTSSSPAALVPLSRAVSEHLTTPGLISHEPPTSSLDSPLLTASPSDPSLLHRPHTPRHGARGNYLISSPNPLHLFSSPTRNHIDVDDRDSCPTGRGTLFHMASSTMRLEKALDTGASESLIQSSNLPREFSSQPLTLRQSSLPPDPFMDPAPPTVDMNYDQTLALETGVGATGGRYSMRMRQPRQLKPYAFDHLEYKHQLKHHPDAIVNLRGHRSPVESSSSPPSSSGEGDGDDGAENPGSERPSPNARILPHTNRKKRHRNNVQIPSAPPPTIHRRTSGVQPSTESPSRNRRVTGSSSIADGAWVASIPDLGGEDSPQEATTWYPDAFNDLSSGLGSDDLPLSTTQNDLRVNQTPLPRVKRRRRAPRQLPHLSPLTSPPRQLSDPSSPRSKPASLGVISLDTSSNTSSSRSELTRGSDNMSEESLVMLDDYAPLPSPEPECSPPQAFQKRRLQPSRYPVITDFFVRGPREKKKKPRKRGIVPLETASRSKRALGRVGTSDPHSADRRNSKARTRRRHERPQQHADLSVFTVAGGRVLSGWQRRNAVTIDTEDVAFHRALEPLVHRARPPHSIRPPSGPPHIRRPPRQALGGPIGRTPSSSSLRVVDPAPDETRHRIVVDFDIPFLSLGKVYTASSYLGKGWLHELLSIISGTPLSHPPPAIEVDGHRLSSVSTALDYTVFLPYACDSFAKVLNDPLAMSHEAFTNWNADMHAVCSLISWILTYAEGNDAHLIRTASLEYTGSLVARIDTALGDSGDRAKSLYSNILCLHWFAVELLVRACWNTTGSDEDLSTALSTRIIGLANRLLQVGVQLLISRIVANNELDDFSLYTCVAELWICLIHLGTIRGAVPEAPGKSKFPSIVEILQPSLAAAESSAQGGLHASEHIWCTLFGLCALSQFSVHGVSTSSARMATSWELVLFALEHIRLVSDPKVDSGLSVRSLRRRDAYIRLVVSRCLILHQRWGWRLDDDASAVLFRRLVEIFKSRKFADLRGEIAGFSGFVQENDVRLLVEHASTDSAFTIFLKLIFASTQQMRPSLREDEYLGRTKKLLSLVTPVGSVQLSALRSPFDEQLSMLYNRFSSLALAIRVLSSAENVLHRFSLARRYVDFGRAAAATRSVCIRAANFLGLQALDMALPVGPMLEWTSEIGDVLIFEFRAAVAPVAGAVAAPLTNEARGRRTELVQCIQLLLSGLHDMSRAATAPANKDPCAALELLQKGCLFPVLAEAELSAIPTIQTLLQAIIDSHLSHALSLHGKGPPQEQHPQPQPSNRVESQDEYGQFDFNWDDPMVLDALNSAAEPAPVPVPVPAATTIQYTYESLIEHIKNIVASPTLFEGIISAFERQQHLRRTGGESVL